jgi:hypothetical protein
MTVFEVSDGSRDMRPYEPTKASDYTYIYTICDLNNRNCEMCG